MVIKKLTDSWNLQVFFAPFVLSKVWLVYLQMIMDIAFYPAILNGSNHDR